MVDNLKKSFTPRSPDGDEVDMSNVTKLRCPVCGVTKDNAYLALINETKKSGMYRCVNCENDFTLPVGTHKRVK